MLPKERFLNAFKHIEGDRVPVFEQSFASSTASEVLGRKAYTGSVSLHRDEAEAWIQGDDAHEEFVNKVRRDVIDFGNAVGFDAVRPPWREAERPTKKLDANTYLFGDQNSKKWAIRKYDPVSESFGTFDSSDKSWGLDELAEFVKEFAGRKTKEFSAADFPDLAYYFEKCGKEKEILGGSSIAIPYDPAIWFEAIILNREIVEMYLDKLVEIESKKIRVMRGMGVKILWAGGDFADKNGPFYGPVVFREVLLPRLKKLCELCHSLGMYYVFRSDGNLWSVADDFFLDSGIDGYGEIDIDSGMDLKRLKEGYGKRITFWGGISAGDTLLQGSKQAIIDAVKKAIEDAAKGGGYIFGSSNSIISGTPAANAILAYETAIKYGKY